MVAGKPAGGEAADTDPDGQESPEQPNVKFIEPEQLTRWQSLKEARKKMMPPPIPGLGPGPDGD